MAHHGLTLVGKEEIIHSGNYHRYVTDPVIDGEIKARGAVPRNLETHPLMSSSRAQAVDIPLIDQSEWPARIADKRANKSQLSDVRMTGMNGGMMPSRDQNGRGYCWAHSTVSNMLLAQAEAGSVYADLSAYAIACIIKNFRDEGGWGALSMDFAIERGCPTSATWPQRGTSRTLDKPETWTDAAKHKVADTWMEAGNPYDRNLTFAQVASLVLVNIAVVVDYNWWSHSVCASDLVDGVSMRQTMRGDSGKLLQLADFDDIWEINRGGVGAGYGVRIWNSWGDSWSEQGMGTLTASKSVPDGAVACRIVRPAA